MINTKHHAGSQCVQFVHTINYLALKVLRKMPLLALVFRRFIDFLNNVQRLHLRALKTTKFMHTLFELSHLDGSIGCSKMESDSLEHLSSHTKHHNRERITLNSATIKV